MTRPRYFLALLMVMALGLPIFSWAADEKSGDAKTDAAKGTDAKSDATKEKTKKSDDQDAAKSKKKNRDADEAKADKTDTKDKSETYTVKKGPFKVELKLDGVLESKQSTEISIHPKT